MWVGGFFSMLTIVSYVCVFIFLLSPWAACSHDGYSRALEKRRFRKKNGRQKGGSKRRSLLLQKVLKCAAGMHQNDQFM